eukprot:COSAG04_NODE_697_length_11055_cov_5.640471_10_plen_253_part_00
MGTSTFIQRNSPDARYQATDEEVATSKQRIEESREAEAAAAAAAEAQRLAAKAAKALAEVQQVVLSPIEFSLYGGCAEAPVCLRQAKAVSIEGHPQADCNGVYTHDSTHEGWPVLKNAKGIYCYRRTPTDSWLLSDTPHGDLCGGSIVAKEGPLPVGAHTWLVWSDKFMDGTLTVGLLVRPPLPSPAACASPPSAPPAARFKNRSQTRVLQTTDAEVAAAERRICEAEESKTVAKREERLPAARAYLGKVRI